MRSEIVRSAELPDHDVEIARQIPDTAFERALLAAVIEATECFRADSPRLFILDEHGNATRHRVRAIRDSTASWDEHGRLHAHLHIEDPDDHPLSWSSMLSDESAEDLPMAFWVGEKLGSSRPLVVMWELPANRYYAWGQSNDADYTPILHLPAR